MTKKELQTVKANLQAVKDSCFEAIEGSWDKSDEGFSDMVELIDEVQTILFIKKER